jgi:GNAT superfamily N-acetyltransferase
MVEEIEWEIHSEPVDDKCIAFSITTNNRETLIATARLYIIYNPTRECNYGLIEDVFVDKKYRRMGFATAIIEYIKGYAKYHKLYKLIATSRFEREHVHDLYDSCGMKKWGYEFRVDIE